MTQYSRGADFERKVKKLWEAEGYFVVRSAGSKGPVDLVAFGATRPVLIQCKISGRISKAKLIELVELAERVNARPFVATKENPIA